MDDKILEIIINIEEENKIYTMLKGSLLKNRNYVQYDDYEVVMNSLNNIESELNKVKTIESSNLILMNEISDILNLKKFTLDTIEGKINHELYKRLKRAIISLYILIEEVNEKYHLLIKSLENNKEDIMKKLKHINNGQKIKNYYQNINRESMFINKNSR